MLTVTCTEGFEWAPLPAGSTVVDVGGGLGTMTMALADTYTHLQYTIQDLPGVIAQAREVSIECER